MASMMKDSTVAVRQEKARSIWSVIDRYAYLRQVDTDELAIKLHCSPATVRNRRNRPQEITLEELFRLQEILHIPWPEIMDAILGERVVVLTDFLKNCHVSINEPN